MKQFLWVMQDELGLHARVAGDLVKCVNSCTSKVTLEKGGKQADASRLFAVMALSSMKLPTLFIELSTFCPALSLVVCALFSA